jgi:hypothetical protein
VRFHLICRPTGTRHFDGPCGDNPAPAHRRPAATAAHPARQTIHTSDQCSHTLPVMHVPVVLLLLRTIPSLGVSHARRRRDELRDAD